VEIRKTRFREGESLKRNYGGGMSCRVAVLNNSAIENEYYTKKGK
jgi:hypothetical protein